MTAAAFPLLKQRKGDGVSRPLGESNQVGRSPTCYPTGLRASLRNPVGCHSEQELHQELPARTGLEQITLAVADVVRIQSIYRVVVDQIDVVVSL